METTYQRPKDTHNRTYNPPPPHFTELTAHWLLRRSQEPPDSFPVTMLPYRGNVHEVTIQQKKCAKPGFTAKPLRFTLPNSRALNPMLGELRPDHPLYHVAQEAIQGSAFAVLKTNAQLVPVIVPEIAERPWTQGAPDDDGFVVDFGNPESTAEASAGAVGETTEFASEENTRRVIPLQARILCSSLVSRLRKGSCPDLGWAGHAKAIESLVQDLRDQGYALPVASGLVGQLRNGRIAAWTLWTEAWRESRALLKQLSSDKTNFEKYLQRLVKHLRADGDKRPAGWWHDRDENLNAATCIIAVTARGRTAQSYHSERIRRDGELEDAVSNFIEKFLDDVRRGVYREQGKFKAYLWKTWGTRAANYVRDYMDCERHEKAGPGEDVNPRSQLLHLATALKDDEGQEQSIAETIAAEHALDIDLSPDWRLEALPTVMNAVGHSAAAAIREYLPSGEDETSTANRDKHRKALKRAGDQAVPVEARMRAEPEQTAQARAARAAPHNERVTELWQQREVERWAREGTPQTRSVTFGQMAAILMDRFPWKIVGDRVEVTL